MPYGLSFSLKYSLIWSTSRSSRFSSRLLSPQEIKEPVGWEQDIPRHHHFHDLLTWENILRRKRPTLKICSKELLFFLGEEVSCSVADRMNVHSRGWKARAKHDSPPGFICCLLSFEQTWTDWICSHSLSPCLFPVHPSYVREKRLPFCFQWFWSSYAARPSARSQTFKERLFSREFFALVMHETSILLDSLFDHFLLTIVLLLSQSLTVIRLLYWTTLPVMSQKDHETTEHRSKEKTSQRRQTMHPSLTSQNKKSREWKAGEEYSRRTQMRGRLNE
jgi:hypothetical protein